MNHAMIILNALDAQLTAPVELVIYGRAALALGFAAPAAEFALSQDVDVIFWREQAEDLLEHTNFWEAVDVVNAALERQGLFITIFSRKTKLSCVRAGAMRASKSLGRGVG